MKRLGNELRIGISQYISSSESFTSGFQSLRCDELLIVILQYIFFRNILSHFNYENVAVLKHLHQLTSSFLCPNAKQLEMRTGVKLMPHIPPKSKLREQ